MKIKTKDISISLENGDMYIDLDNTKSQESFLTVLGGIVLAHIVVIFLGATVGSIIHGTEVSTIKKLFDNLTDSEKEAIKKYIADVYDEIVASLQKMSDVTKDELKTLITKTSYCNIDDYEVEIEDADTKKPLNKKDFKNLLYKLIHARQVADQVKKVNGKLVWRDSSKNSDFTGGNLKIGLHINDYFTDGFSITKCESDERKLFKTLCTDLKTKMTNFKLIEYEIASNSGEFDEYEVPDVHMVSNATVYNYVSFYISLKKDKFMQAMSPLIEAIKSNTNDKKNKK